MFHWHSFISLQVEVPKRLPYVLEHMKNPGNEVAVVSRCQTAFSRFSLCGRERGSGHIVSTDWCSQSEKISDR